MKVRVRYRMSQAIILEMPSVPVPTVATLEESVRHNCGIDSSSRFRLSLNGVDGLEAGASSDDTPLTDVGLVSGDTVWVLDLPDTNNVPSVSPAPEDPSCSAQTSKASLSQPIHTKACFPPPPHPEGAASSASKTDAGVKRQNISDQSQVMSQGGASGSNLAPSTRAAAGSPAGTAERLQAFLTAMQLQLNGASELLVAICHFALAEMGFYCQGKSSGDRDLPENWQGTSSLGMYRLRYAHPNTDTQLELAVVVNYAGSFTESLTFQVNLATGNETTSKSLDVQTAEHVKPDVQQGFNTSCLWEPVCSVSIFREFAESVSDVAVGSRSLLVRTFKALGGPVRGSLCWRVIRHLPVAAICRLASTSKYLRELIDRNDEIWRLLIQRDFPQSQSSDRPNVVAPNAKETYKEYYNNQRSLARNRARHGGSLVPPWYPVPPPQFLQDPQPWDPRHPAPFPGMIGGPHDLIPPAGPQMPLGVGRMRPRFDPLMPDDPDLGLFGHPDRPRRRGRGGPGAGHLPFGGGFGPRFL